MTRYTFWPILGLLFVLGSACQLDSKASIPFVAARPTATPTLTATVTPLPSHTPSLTPTPRPTFSPTPSPSPTETPSPTATPIPSDRLVLALQAFTVGDYDVARTQFDALLEDPGAEVNERRLALHWRGRSERLLGDASAAIATLKQFLRKYPSDELVRAAQFNLAIAYEQNGQLEEALTAYLGTIIPDDPVNVYIYERIGDTALRVGEIEGAIDAYLAGIDSTEDAGFKVHLREAIAAVELQRDNPAGALTQYDQILTIAKIEAYRAKILRLAGEVHQQMEDTEAAHARYLEAVENYPQAYDSYLALVELVNADIPVDEFQRGLIDYYAQAYQPAIAAFERYLDPLSAPPSPPLTSTTTLTLTETISDVVFATTSVAEASPPPRAAEALWFSGQAWQALGQYNRAITTFRRLIDNHPDDEHWGQAHLEIGKARFGQDNITQAKIVFRDFVAKNPKHPLAAEALWRAARLELDGDLLEAAHKNLNVLAQTYPESQFTDDALYWAGRAAFLMEDYEQAADTWAALFEDYPDSDLASFGGYWQAQALLNLSQDQAAERVLTQIAARSNEYYGLRARDLLAGRGPHSVPLSLPTPAQARREQAQAEAWLTEWLDLPPKDDLTSPGLQIQSDPAFQRGQALLDLGLRPEALIEFETVRDNWRDDPLAMYQLAVYFSQQGLGRLSILCAVRTIFLSPASRPDEAPLFIQRLYYPIFFADTIFTEAEAFDQDPALIISIMRQESLFEPSAESIVGARGLMQVMPATGEYVAERSDFGQFDIDQLWHPYISIKFGAWYIDQQLAIFEGNQFAALAAYNAGPGNVLEWIKTSDDLDIFVESIPFRESRLYIRNIYTNLAAYRRLYGLPPNN